MVFQKMVYFVVVYLQNLLNILFYIETVICNNFNTNLRFFSEKSVIVIFKIY